MIKSSVSVCILMLILIAVSGQTLKTDGFFDPDYIRNQDHIYINSINTPILYNSEDILSDPIIQLNSGQTLTLSFDDLNNNYKSFKYSFKHCDANWNDSDLKPQDFIEGFYEDFVTDFKFSLNTTKPYIHYTLRFPTDYMKLTISGNYIITVFEEDSDEVVLTMRFMVYEPKLPLTAVVKWSDNVDEKRTHQQVNFTINRSGYYIPRFEKDIKVFVKQNGRWDNIKANLKASVINEELIVYDLPDQTTFTADNEFRYLDLKNFRYNSDRVSQISFDQSGFNVFLKNDTVKRFTRYLTWSDINGKFFIGAEQTDDAEIEADYCHVHFSLPYDYPLVHGSLYLMGQLTRWQLSPGTRMNYNFEQKKYELEMLLKQGYYNYQYVFLENGSSSADASFIEGSFFETENDYSILVYSREPGYYYDKLIAFQKLNSLKTKSVRE